MADAVVSDLGAFAAGEVPPNLVITFNDSDGNPINLGTFSTIQINIEEELAGTSGLATGTVNYVDAGTGQLGYSWVKADMANPGQYTLQGWVSDGTKYFASDLYIYTVYDGPGEAPA